MFTTDTARFAQLLLFLSLAVVAAVLSHRLTARLRVPAPALFLAAAALAAAALPGLEARPDRTVERIVTVALICILFDGAYTSAGGDSGPPPLPSWLRASPGRSSQPRPSPRLPPVWPWDAGARRQSLTWGPNVSCTTSATGQNSGAIEYRMVTE